MVGKLVRQLARSLNTVSVSQNQAEHPVAGPQYMHAACSMVRINLKSPYTGQPCPDARSTHLKQTPPDCHSHPIPIPLGSGLYASAIGCNGAIKAGMHTAQTAVAPGEQAADKPRGYWACSKRCRPVIQPNITDGWEHPGKLDHFQHVATWQ